MPCLNEERTIVGCIDEAKRFIQKSGVDAEILIVDNGSCDRSVYLAEKNGARVVKAEQKGYGNALRCGIGAAEGEYIIMGDCDGSYDFENLEPFLNALRKGASLVVGNRFLNHEKGAIPPLHKYFGVPFLSWLGRVKYRCSICDFHCGLRGINAADFKRTELVCGGMEFATEMIAAASRAGYTMCNVPTFFRRDGRVGKSHLRTWRDGMRHLIYILTK